MPSRFNRNNLPQNSLDWAELLCDLHDAHYQGLPGPRAQALLSGLTASFKSVKLNAKHWMAALEACLEPEETEVVPDTAEVAEIRKYRIKLFSVLLDLCIEDRDFANKFSYLAPELLRTRAHFNHGLQEREGQWVVGYNTKGRWEPRGRTYTSIGRFVLDVLRNWFNEAQCEEYTYAIMSSVGAMNLKFEILSGEQIVNVYRDKICPSACMSNERGAHHAALYAANPEKCRMLLCYAGAKVIGRAILWKTDNGLNLLERIYPNQGMQVRMIQKWAKEQGFFCRDNQSKPPGYNHGSYNMFLNSEGDTVPSGTFITLNKPKDRQDIEHPFMDSFPHLFEVPEDRWAVVVGRGQRDTVQGVFSLRHASYWLRQVSIGADVHYKPCKKCGVTHAERQPRAGEGDPPMAQVPLLDANGECSTCSGAVGCRKCGQIWISRIHQPEWRIVRNSPASLCNVCSRDVTEAADEDGEDFPAEAVAVAVAAGPVDPPVARAARIAPRRPVAAVAQWDGPVAAAPPVALRNANDDPDF